MVIGTLHGSSLSSLTASSLRWSLEKMKVIELERNQEQAQFTVTFVCRSLSVHHHRASALAGIHTFRSLPSICQPGGPPPQLLNASSLFSELNIVWHRTSPQTCRCPCLQGFPWSLGWGGWLTAARRRGEERSQDDMQLHQSLWRNQVNGAAPWGVFKWNGVETEMKI